MEVYRVECCERETWVTLGLFSNISNASWLRNEATSGRMEAVLLDPTLIASPFHVLAAVAKAMVALEQDQLKTKSVFSEIIFSLSPSSNISNSFKSFGIKDSSENVLVVMIHHDKNENKFDLLRMKVEGELVPMAMLELLHQQEEIFKFYKIPAEEQRISSVENSVVTRLVIKDVS